MRLDGLIDHRYASAWLYGAVRPGIDDAFALVMKDAGIAAIQVFLSRFAASLPTKAHAALLLDGAGWHIADAIVVPASVSLVFLPPCRPKLNPAERPWLHLRERYRSIRLFANLDDIIDGCCDAWSRMVQEPARVASLTNYPYLQKSGFHEAGIGAACARPRSRKPLQVFV